MKSIILNSKGGVGKSTTAVQVVAPYMYVKCGKNEKINLIEFDDENEDSLTFIKSNILNTKRVKITGNDIDGIVTDISLDNDNLIVDVGGNKTTTIILNSLENSGILSVFDVVFIPLTDGEQDAINAINVYQKIRSLNDEIKIIFVLSRVNINMNLEIQFLDFFGDNKGKIDDREGLIEKIKEDDRNIIKLYDNESVKYSRAFGISVYEMCNKPIQDLKDKLKEELKDNRKEDAKKTSYKVTISNTALSFKEDCLVPAFNEIQRVLG